MRLNRSLYHVPEWTEADGTKFSAGSLEDLFRLVAEYRVRKGLPAGNPEEEFTARMCLEFPAMCHRRGAAPRKAVGIPSGAGGLKEKVLTWLAAVVQRPTAKVSKAEADRRAQVCAACPMMRDSSGGCSSCADTMRALRNEILGARRESYPGLGGCAVLGEDCRASVWIEQPAANNPQLPVKCWRKPSN